ncbi:MAG: peptidoglycan-binding domain-containing protein [Acidobacteriota bacterium]
MSKRILAAVSSAAVLLVSTSAVAQYQTREYGGSSAVHNAADLPPNARPGECYARVYVPPQYQTQTEQILKAEASERLSIIPATYDTVTEQVMVKPPTEQLVEVPARYENRTETIQVAPARTEWQKGPCDPKREVANATGECLCLVEIPPRYKTVNQRVMVAPPTTKRVTSPAQYKTITKTVMVNPAQEQRTPIPAEYQTVTRQVMVSDASMKWVEIDCNTRAPIMDRDTCMALQRALKANGHDPGPIDGIFGVQTRGALRSFQEANNLSVGGLTSETRRALGM